MRLLSSGQFITGSQYPGEMVWTQCDTEQLAILGSWPSKANTHGLKEEASLKILGFGGMFALDSCLHGSDSHASWGGTTPWAWPVVTTTGRTHQNSPSSSTVIPIFSLSLLLTFCHSSELWGEYRIITVMARGHTRIQEATWLQQDLSRAQGLYEAPAMQPIPTLLWWAHLPNMGGVQHGLELQLPSLPVELNPAWQDFVWPVQSQPYQ